MLNYWDFRILKRTSLGVSVLVVHRTYYSDFVKSRIVAIEREPATIMGIGGHAARTMLEDLDLVMDAMNRPVLVVDEDELTA